MDDQELLDAALLAAVQLLSQGEVQAAQGLQGLLKDMPKLRSLVESEGAPEEPKKSLRASPANRLLRGGSHAR